MNTYRTASAGLAVVLVCVIANLANAQQPPWISSTPNSDDSVILVYNPATKYNDGKGVGIHSLPELSALVLLVVGMLGLIAARQTEFVLRRPVAQVRELS